MNRYTYTYCILYCTVVPGIDTLHTVTCLLGLWASKGETLYRPFAVVSVGVRVPLGVFVSRCPFVVFLCYSPMCLVN